MPDGTVFYVGMGSGGRANDFSTRTPAHKRMVNKIGRQNVRVQRFPCAPGEAPTMELELLIFHVSAGSPLVNAAFGTTKKNKLFCNSPLT